MKTNLKGKRRVLGQAKKSRGHWTKENQTTFFIRRLSFFSRDSSPKPLLFCNLNWERIITRDGEVKLWCKRDPWAVFYPSLISQTIRVLPPAPNPSFFVSCLTDPLPTLHSAAPAAPTRALFLLFMQLNYIPHSSPVILPTNIALTYDTHPPRRPTFPLFFSTERNALSRSMIKATLPALLGLSGHNKMKRKTNLRLDDIDLSIYSTQSKTSSKYNVPWF